MQYLPPKNRSHWMIIPRLPGMHNSGSGGFFRFRFVTICSEFVVFSRLGSAILIAIELFERSVFPMYRHQTFAAALLFLLTLTACRAEAPAGVLPDPDPYPPFNETNSTCWEIDGLRIALPLEYLDRLTVSDSPKYESSSRERVLLSVSETASIEAAKADFGDGAGFGYLFGLAVLDQVGLEQFLCMDYPGTTVFATDGERYYTYVEPTDVQFYRPGDEILTESEDWGIWESLNQIGPLVREDFITRNGLQSFTVQDYKDQLMSEDGNHVCVKYYLYYLKDGDTHVYCQLLLHQPARQGNGGIWAVDQWLDESGNQYLYFPDSGMPSAEYYAQLQTACDNGETPELRTLAGAAAVFVRDAIGNETTKDCFEVAGEVNTAYIEWNKRLQQLSLNVVYRPDEVSGTDLLECVGAATADNWGVLERFRYGTNWFEPLMTAVSDASIGDNQQWRDKMVLSFYLATGETQTDFHSPLSGILRAQKDKDPASYQAALEEFTEEEREILLGAHFGVASSPVRSDIPEVVDVLTN